MPPLTDAELLQALIDWHGTREQAEHSVTCDDCSTGCGCCEYECPTGRQLRKAAEAQWKADHASTQ